VPILELRSEFVPITTVPEITIAEDGNTMSVKNDIGLARQAGDILAIAQSSTPEQPSKEKLMGSIYSAVLFLRARAR